MMLVRSGKRLETTLLSSRQGLCRPARLYSSPSPKRTAPAAASLQQVPRPDYPPFLAQQQSPQKLSISEELDGFLKRGMPPTILPTPRPDYSSSPANSMWFVDTPTQDLLAVMDACLHNFYDVPRAKVIFDRLRARIGNPALETRIYNAFLEAYVKLASTCEGEQKDYWVSCAWELYDNLENEREKFTPNASTYATMLMAWQRFHAVDNKPVYTDTSSYNPASLLTSIQKRKIDIDFVIADRVYESSDEAADVIKTLSRTAVTLNMPQYLEQLGQAEAIGASEDPLNGVPEARPVLRVKKSTQSTAGLSDEEIAAAEEQEPEYEIPFNLDNLRRHLASVSFARRVLPDDIAARQKLLEESVYDVAVERLNHENEVFSGLGISGKPVKSAELQKWMWDWHLKLKDRLKEEIENIEAHENESRFSAKAYRLSPYFALVKAERLSLITILEIMRLQGAGGIAEGMKTTRALMQVGRAVEMEYKAQMCRRNNIFIPESTKAGNAGYFSSMGYSFLQERRLVAARYMEDGEAWTATWTQPIRAKVGGILVECLMDVAKIERTLTGPDGTILKEEHPAFYHTYEHQRGQKLGVIKLHKLVSERMGKDGVRSTLHPRHLPMLVKPKPWLNHQDGGYFYNKTSAMRFKDSVEQQSYLKHASDLGNVELVYAGLDVLGATPWKINEKIFHVVLDVWNSGDRLGKLPPVVFDQPEPVPSPDMDVLQKTKFAIRMKQYNQDKANNHSDRCNVNYKIEIARAFLGDVFYQPHNVDFRGRAYPIPPHLNHIGDDLSRGLLMFAEKKPLGERGLRWMKIQLAGLYGYDKASFDDRVKWVTDHLDDIYDSATNPLKGRKWWMNADDPWQCLACCIDLHAALESPNPLEYESCIPVHQDGTCNGLQHYAALGGDAAGAAQVNLQAGDKPSDVYTFVGNMAERMIAQDAEKGDHLAQTLQGRITRKIVKQTVMTTVYGVTFIGAREQIERQLKALPWCNAEEAWALSAYLAKVVLACIGDLFKGAKDIQNWFTLCAQLIAKSIPGERISEALAEHLDSIEDPRHQHLSTLPMEKLKKEQMTTVVWTTPLGLPIVQPYRKPRRKQVMTAVQTVFIEDPNCPSGVNGMKQASAFPPNFIHSLDATHMMLTALECRTQDLTFAAVHDSYWTHACSIDTMSRIIRDTFIALHSSDVLVKLRDEFLERYKDYKVPMTVLNSPSLIKKLERVGTHFTVTPEQAKAMPTMSKIITISDDAASSSITESAPSVAKLEYPSVDTDIQEDMDEEPQEDLMDGLEDEDMEAEDVRRELKARKRAIVNDKMMQQLSGKFVNLTDLIPPLPKKGNFQVENIKESPYFFS